MRSLSRFLFPVQHLLDSTPEGVFEAISGHNTRVARAPAATPTVFTDIAEMKDVTPPELNRNEFDATTQTLNIDTYVVGVLRRSGFTMSLNALDTDPTQDHLTGLLKAMVTEPPPVDGYRMTFPSGVIWVMSGQVSKFAPKYPVDGLAEVAVTIRPTGRMTINGIIIG
jgi:hypothetical protein